MKLSKKFAVAAVLGGALLVGAQQPAQAQSHAQPEDAIIGAILGVLGAVQEDRLRNELRRCVISTVRSGDAERVANRIVRNYPQIRRHVQRHSRQRGQEWRNFTSQVALQMCRQEMGLRNEALRAGPYQIFVPPYMLERPRFVNPAPRYPVPPPPRQPRGPSIIIELPLR